MRGISHLVLTNGVRRGNAARLVVLALLATSTALMPRSAAHAANNDESPVSITSVSASFLPNPGDSGAFTATPATPVAFTQDFLGINFNTPPGTVTCSNTTGVSNTNRPFTNVVPQAD